MDLHNIIQISPTLNHWIYIIAEKLDWYVIFLGIMFILIHTHKYRENKPQLISRRSLKEGVYILLGVVIAWGISYIMKISFAIPRPFLQFPEIAPLFIHGGYNSFPSGHATFFAALATAIFLSHRKIGVLFIVAAFLIGITRVIAGVHFPIDVIFGWLLGIFVSYITYHHFVQKIRK
jgi:membrane-associated phospholipid phosphatase